MSMSREQVEQALRAAGWRDFDRGDWESPLGWIVRLDIAHSPSMAWLNRSHGGRLQPREELSYEELLRRLI